MSKTKSTKSALLMSFTSLLLCFAMLIGSTFAWFTDSATTAVNKIQSGKLDVQLLDAQGASLEGQTLGWVAADGRAQGQILWEPGCTYNTESFYIKNNGNLNLDRGSMEGSFCHNGVAVFLPAAAQNFNQFFWG